MFNDEVWMYRGGRVRFDFRSSGGQPVKPLDGFTGDLARCFATAAIAESLSLEAVNGRLYGLKWLSPFMNNTEEAWGRLSKKTLNNAIRALQEKRLETTVYNRANAIKSLVDYLGSITHKDEGVFHTFLVTRLRWKPGIKNPTRSTFQKQFSVTKTSSKSKYDPDLQTCLGQARYRIRVSSNLEPYPGYDRIRLESLAYSAALGLRIGEVVSLPINALDTEDLPFVRVFTEKGAPAAARPLPESWVPVISEANDYLLDACAEARARAREIEKNGFVFVSEAILERRKDRPLSKTIIDQLVVLGLTPEKYCTTEEITQCFDVSMKEVLGDGKYGDAKLALPRPVAASLIRWIDERMRRWDWEAFGFEWNGAPNCKYRYLSPYQIAEYSGVPRSCISKARWFIEELRCFLLLVNNSGVFQGIEVAQKVVFSLQKMWSRIRETALERRGHNHGYMISIDGIIEILRRRYQRNLERHYRSISDDADDQKVFSSSPVNFSSVPLSRHLVVVWEHQFSGYLTRGILPRPITRADYYNYLATNPGKTTIFQRLDIRGSDGKHFSITPHLIRHWVTTALLRSGPSEMMVDLWMGRKPGQSRSYDHRTAAERAQVAKQMYSAPIVPCDYLGKRVIAMRDRGIPAEEIMAMIDSKVRVMHFVPWGLCSRDLYASPCNKGLLCLRGFGTDTACESFHIDVKSQESRAAIEALHDQYLTMLRTLEPAVEDIRLVIERELSTSEPLDQHLRMICDVIRGCEQALLAFDSADQGVVEVSKFRVRGVRSSA